jgi:tetratricopeptide (TPR) repeat protein
MSTSLMNESAASNGGAGSSTQLEAAVQQCIASRLRFWAWSVGLPLVILLTTLTVLLALQTARTTSLTRELEALKADAVRFGDEVEIYNPAWGTVIDAVDPTRIPSRDARDPRFGAVVQQFVPRGNPAQAFQLRMPSPPPGHETPLPESSYIKHGFSFLKARDFNRAIQTFEYCLTFYPDSARAHSGHAIALRDRGSFGQALTSHDRALELEPQSGEFRWERAVTHLRNGDSDSAIKDCQFALEKVPHFADAHNTMAIALRNRRQYAAALEQHNLALEQNPDREDFWRERGLTHQANGDQQKSAADARHAAELRQSRP